MDCEECHKTIEEGWENTWLVGSKTINICFICYRGKRRAEKEIGWIQAPQIARKIGVEVYEKNEGAFFGNEIVIISGSARKDNGQKRADQAV